MNIRLARIGPRRLCALAVSATAMLPAVACDSDTNGSGEQTDASAGGEPSSGGSVGSGGRPSTGGKSSGGTPSSGGGTSTGGKSAAGGAAGEGGIEDAGPSSVNVHFAAQVGAKAFDCTATYSGLGTNDSELLPNDFRFYVHDVRLLEGTTETPVALSPDGKWQTGDVALLDFENGKGTCTNGTTDMNAVVKGTVPAGKYTGIVFRVGVPEELNHANPSTAPSPLNVSALEWDWTYGHKFMKIDFSLPAMGDGGTGMDAGMPMPMDAGMGMPMEGGMVMPMGGNTVFFHLGGGLCSGSLADAGVHCKNENRPEIRFASFDPEKQQIVVDYAAIVAGIAPGHDLGAMPGCMSSIDDPECKEMLSAVGLDVATGDTKAGQTAFRVAAQ